MKDCLTCELTNAQKRTVRFLNMGWTLEAVAAHLSDVYAESYYIEGNAMYRKSKLPPYAPHLIIEVNE